MDTSFNMLSKKPLGHFNSQTSKYTYWFYLVLFLSEVCIHIHNQIHKSYVHYIFYQDELEVDLK